MTKSLAPHRLGAVLLALGAALVAPARAEIGWERVDRLAAEIQRQVVEWRRWFHQHPELSNREFETAARLESILREMGLEPRTGIAHTGLVAVIEGGRPGPLVAIRADIDGLPVTEQTGLPFASTATTDYAGRTTGVMHACGHDGHMAMVLGAAAVLNAVRDELPGSVMLIFQPAEEGPPPGEEGGAQLMLAEGILEDRKPVAIFGAHLGVSVPGGRIALRAGPAMAAVDRFTLVVEGKQSHGSQPWNGIDPIVVSAQIVLGLQTIASRQLDVTNQPAVISVGMIHGGIRFNIIPDEVELEGTIRTFDEQMRRAIHERIRRTATSIAASAGATAEVSFELGAPSLVNDPDLAAAMRPTLERVMGERGVYDPPLLTPGEDFALFANEVPGLYFFLGAVPPDADPTTAPSNHSPMFTIHEPVLETGVRAFAHLVVDYLEQHE